MAKVKCPKCKGTNVETLGNKRKAVSVGKAAVGGLIAGPPGLLVGFAGKQGKYEVFCRNCGKRWKE